MSLRLKEINQVMVRCYMSKANMLMLGKPGIGKTCSIEHFVEKMRERIPDFKVWHFYGPTMSPMDIQAGMPDVATGTIKMYSNASIPNAYATPDVKGVVFIGEMLNTDPTTLKLLQKYVNGEDMNGVLRKPDGVMVLADSNRLEDKAGVMQQFRALLNRFLTVDVYTDENDNTEYAQKMEWHAMVQAFFRENPNLIDNYEKVFAADAGRGTASKQNDQMAEEGKRGIWACMRGWNRVSDLEYTMEELGGGAITVDEITGSVGTGPGMQYHTFKQIVSRLASVEEVLANPEGVKIPEKIDELYALAMIVSLRCKAEDLKTIYTFAKRIQYDMQVFMLKTMMGRKNFPLVGSETYRSWVLDPQVNKLVNAR
jgi:hypothetical protein